MYSAHQPMPQAMDTAVRMGVVVMFIWEYITVNASLMTSIPTPTRPCACRAASTTTTTVIHANRLPIKQCPATATAPPHFEHFPDLCKALVALGISIEERRHDDERQGGKEGQDGQHNSNDRCVGAAPTRPIGRIPRVTLCNNNAIASISSGLSRANTHHAAKDVGTAPHRHSHAL